MIRTKLTAIEEWIFANLFKFVGLMLCYLIVMMMLVLGVDKAYEVSSQSEIGVFYAEESIKVLEEYTGANRIAFMLFFIPILGGAKIVSLITYNYLLWVPEGVWKLLLSGLALVPVLLIAGALFSYYFTDSQASEEIEEGESA